jgi:hypothetical protein
MALNFPDPATQTPINTWSPTSTPSASTNGLTYLWDGTKWGTTGGPDVHVLKSGDTMTGLLNIGSAGTPLTGNSLIAYNNDGANGTVFARNTADGPVLEAAGAGGAVNATINGDGSAVFAGDAQMASLNGGQLAGYRNVLINGAMMVHQRGTSNSSALAAYLTADRWLSNSNSTSSIFNDTALAPIGFAKALRVNRSSGSPWVAQGVELPQLTNGNLRGPGPFVGNSVWTLSWWTKQAADTPGVSFNDGVATTQNSVAHTVDAPVAIQTEGAWTRYASKVTMVADTTASVDRCLRVILNTGVGASTDFEIVGVQLEPGPVATPFEQRPIGTELALCQRYYYKMTDYTEFDQPTGVGSYNMYYPTVMRAKPTLVILSPVNIGGTDAGVSNTVDAEL